MSVTRSLRDEYDELVEFPPPASSLSPPLSSAAQHIHAVYNSGLTNFHDISRRHPRYTFQEIPEDLYDTAHTHPFNGTFFRDYPGEPVPER